MQLRLCEWSYSEKKKNIPLQVFSEKRKYFSCKHKFYWVSASMVSHYFTLHSLGSSKKNLYCLDKYFYFFIMAYALRHIKFHIGFTSIKWLVSAPFKHWKKLGSAGKLIFRVTEMDMKTLSASALLHGNIFVFLELSPWGLIFKISK